MRLCVGLSSLFFYVTIVSAAVLASAIESTKVNSTYHSSYIRPLTSNQRLGAATSFYRVVHVPVVALHSLSKLALPRRLL